MTPSRGEPIALFAPIDERSMAELEERYDVVRVWSACDRARALANPLQAVRIAVCNGQIGMSVSDMRALPNLRLIACYGAGYDGVDVEAAKALGIAVTNTPEVLDECVADLAFGLVIDVIRRVSSADRFVRSRRWPQEEFPLTDTVNGKVMGVLGLGQIGKAIARRAESFRMEVCYTGRNRQPVPYRYLPNLMALAAACDVLVIAVPGGAATRCLVDAKVLDALGSGGFLVNVSRGTVVDESALVRALQRGRIAGAALDVFADEPRVPEPLLSMENVVLQPHIASGTHRTRRAMGQLVLHNIEAFLAGKPLKTAVT